SASGGRPPTLVRSARAIPCDPRCSPPFGRAAPSGRSRRDPLPCDSLPARREAEEADQRGPAQEAHDVRQRQQRDAVAGIPQSPSAERGSVEEALRRRHPPVEGPAHEPETGEKGRGQEKRTEEPERLVRHCLEPEPVPCRAQKPALTREE